MSLCYTAILVFDGTHHIGIDVRLIYFSIIVTISFFSHCLTKNYREKIEECYIFLVESCRSIGHTWVPILHSLKEQDNWCRILYKRFNTRIKQQIASFKSYKANLYIMKFFSKIEWTFDGSVSKNLTPWK